MRSSRPHISARGTHRRGAVLIAVIFVTVAIAGLALVLCRSVRVEAMASANHVAAMQAAAVERGAEQYVLALLAQQADTWMDLDESYFYAVPLADGYFWLIRPDYGDPSLPLFGLVDEGSKINLNSARPEMLLALPNIPPELTFSIVDWVDGNQDIDGDGAEDGYYLSLPDPYRCKNAPFETVEEVLLVRGAYPQLLYGNAPNAPVGTGMNSGFGSSFSGGLTADHWVARGLYDLMTVYSQQPGAQQSSDDNGNGGSGGGGGNDDDDDDPFMNVNRGSHRNRLREMLTATLGEQRAQEIASGDNFDDIFDFYIKRHVTPEEFALFGNDIVTENNSPRRGRINLNTAPREVLMCLPDMDQSKADKIIAARQNNVDRRSLAWVAEALGEEAVGIGEDDLVTGKSYQFSADILAVSADGRAFKRCRIVVDTADGTPRIIHRRDLTERGWPLERQVLDSIRTGNGVPGSVGMNSMTMTTGAQY